MSDTTPPVEPIKEHWNDRAKQFYGRALQGLIRVRSLLVNASDEEIGTATNPVNVLFRDGDGTEIGTPDDPVGVQLRDSDGDALGGSGAVPVNVVDFRTRIALEAMLEELKRTNKYLSILTDVSLE